MTIGHFDEKHSQELMFADTNVQLVLICSSGYNLQYKPFCDWLTLIEQKCHPSKLVLRSVYIWRQTLFMAYQEAI